MGRVDGRFQGVSRGHRVEVILVELILVLPYVATVVPLAGLFGRAVPPKALGVAYTKAH